MALQWEVTTITWRLREHEMWHATDAYGQVVGQVALQVDGQSSWWTAHYWGHLPSTLPLATRSSDPTRIGRRWPSVDEATAAVEDRHTRR